MSHYALSNISAAGRATAVNAFRTLAYISEGMVFVYLGMDAFDPDKWKVRIPAVKTAFWGCSGPQNGRTWSAFAG